MSAQETAASPLRFVYTNYKGETALRTVRGPITMHFKATQHHHEPQWIMNAFCLDRNEWRSFALRDCDFVLVDPDQPYSDQSLVDILKLRGNNYRTNYFETQQQVRELQATLVEVRADAAAAWDKCEERRLEAKEAQDLLAKERKAHEKDLASWEENYAALGRERDALRVEVEAAKLFGIGFPQASPGVQEVYRDMARAATTEMSDTEELAKRLEDHPLWEEFLVAAKSSGENGEIELFDIDDMHDAAWNILKTLSAEVETLRKGRDEAVRERDNYQNLYEETLQWVTRTREQFDRAEALAAEVEALRKRLDETEGVLSRISEVGDEPADGSIDSLYEYSKGLADEHLARIDAKPLMCDCVLGHNGLGLNIRECDCRYNHPAKPEASHE